MNGAEDPRGASRLSHDAAGTNEALVIHQPRR